MNFVETKWLNKNEIDKAALLIQKGEIVAFPTDTVYGLGADATNEEAVEKIFQAKGRPSNRPISVLLSDAEDVTKYAKDIPNDVWLLTETFWPGPLTIILKNRGLFAPTVTAGKDTIGLRMPKNQVALDFIHASGVPLATPSANTSGRPSPTKAEHVRNDLEGKISAIIDGGETSTGIESTVLDFSNPERPVILRPGNISKIQIEETIQRKVYSKEPDKSEKHYKPTLPLFIVKSSWEEAIEQMLAQNEKVAILANETLVKQYKEKVTASFSLGDNGDINSANRLLFDGLRTLEQTEATVILAEPYEKGDLSLPYMNRLLHAAEKKSI